MSMAIPHSSTIPIFPYALRSAPDFLLFIHGPPRYDSACMKHQRIVYSLFLCLLVALLASCRCPCPASRPTALYQVSTLPALMDGCYDGVVTCGELKTRGTLGIGTFDRLDGEMILVDGIVYQAKADGVVVPADNSVRVPFAAVSPLTPATVGVATNVPLFDELKRVLDRYRTSNNQFYLIRVDGLFTGVKYRSVPAQTKPYPKLTAVAARQPVFERKTIRGSLVGFWSPDFARTLTFPGYHLHFISDDRQSGGHLLDCTLESGTLRMVRLPTVALTLPQNEAFDRFQPAGDVNQAMKAAESGK